MSTPWNMLVKQIFDKNRASDKTYRLGDAMKDAKKVYRKTAKKATALVKLPFGKKQRSVKRVRRFTEKRGRRRGRGRGRKSRGGELDNFENTDEVVVGGNELKEKGGEPSSGFSSWF